MNLEGLKRRIEKSKLKILSQDSFMDFHSQLIRELNGSGHIAYVGIQSNEGMSTIIGAQELYYAEKSGELKEIKNSDFLNVLKKNGMELGKKGQFEFIHLDNGSSVWVMNGSVMSAIWSIILFLEREKLTS